MNKAKKTTGKSTSMFRRIFVPIFCLMIVQSGIFFFAAVYGGVIDSLNTNADEILSERVINRKNEIETTFNVQWADMTSYVDIINDIYNDTKNSKGPLYNDTEGQKQFLGEVSKTLIRMIRDNEVNGVFIIMNDSEEFVPLGDEVQKKYGLCIRDYDVNSSYTDEEDLLVVRCPSATIKTVGCSLETWWDAFYSFSNEYNSDYYYKPLKAAYDNPQVASDNLAYFCGPHNYTTNDKTVISYSMPLMDDTGYPYAVIGIEITQAYLESLLPSEELYGSNVGSYAVVTYNEGEEEFHVIASDGIYYQKAFGYSDTIAAKNIAQNMYTLKDNSGNDVIISLSNLKIYNDNTPFNSDKLAICGIIDRKLLYEFSQDIRNKLFFVTIVVLFIGVAGIIYVSKKLTSPITALSKRVRSMEADSKIEFEHLNISEIDLLISSIEELNHNVSENKARTDFFSRMSHDMRTPMNAIIGFSSPEMLESSTEEQKNEYFSKIHTSGKFLLGLINEVLDMTKIGSGKMELHKAPILAKEMVSSTLIIVEEVAKHKDINLEVTILDDDDYYVNIDGQRTSQVFMNLLSNAIKFTEPGGKVEYKQELIRRDEKKAAHKITVRDNGRGMSEEFMNRLYVPFAQEGAGNEGTGLGLSISKKIVELMGGVIKCTSKLGEGTTFEIIMYSEIAHPTEPVVKKTVIEEDYSILQEKHILLCEDNKINTQIAKKLLELKGMIVDCASNGKECCDMFAASVEGYYDAILMDIRMPVMTGLEASRKIRDMSRDDVRDLVIVAMTANAFAEDIDETRKAGMNAHLSKPVDPQKLYLTLADLLRKKY